MKIEYAKGKTKGSVESYDYSGIGSGFFAQGDERVGYYSRRFRGTVMVDMRKEFKTLKAAKLFMERHGYTEVSKSSGIKKGGR